MLENFSGATHELGEPKSLLPPRSRQITDFERKAAALTPR